MGHKGKTARSLRLVLMYCVVGTHITALMLYQQTTLEFIRWPASTLAITALVFRIASMKGKHIRADMKVINPNVVRFVEIYCAIWSVFFALGKIGMIGESDRDLTYSFLGFATSVAFVLLLDIPGETVYEK